MQLRRRWRILGAGNMLEHEAFPQGPRRASGTAMLRLGSRDAVFTTRADRDSARPQGDVRVAL
jgi:hypothetical protein